MKSIFKKWWFWVIIFVVAIAIIGSSTDSTESAADSAVTDTTATETPAVDTTSTVVYEKVDLQQMLDDLDTNALKAEKTYQDKYIQIACKIANFDSDGKYISVEPVNASEWNFITAMCYIKNDAQLDFLLEKSVGDTVTIEGKVISIGEVLGYSINIDQID